VVFLYFFNVYQGLLIQRNVLQQHYLDCILIEFRKLHTHSLDFKSICDASKHLVEREMRVLYHHQIFLCQIERIAHGHFPSNIHRMYLSDILLLYNHTKVLPDSFHQRHNTIFQALQQLVGSHESFW